MESTLIDKVENELEDINMGRHRLLFIVSDTFNVSFKFIAERIEVPYMNINYELSKVLKDISIKKRPRSVNNYLKQLIKEKSSSVLVLDHIDILFDSQLQQDPVLLLEDISRNYTLIVGWRGKTNGESLVYADQDHVEYYRRAKTDGVILSQ